MSLGEYAPAGEGTRMLAPRVADYRDHVPPMCGPFARGGRGFWAIVLPTPYGRGVETHLLEYEVVIALTVSGTFRVTISY
jgi:hypothetical protein